jgi:predicted dehydrogenase
MGWPDALRNAIQAYYNALDGDAGETRYATFRDGFRHMAFVEACVRSSREKRWVEVEKL